MAPWRVSGSITCSGLKTSWGVLVEPELLDGSGNQPEPDIILTTRIPDAPVIPGVRHTAPLMSLTYGVFVNAGAAAIRGPSDLEGSRVAIVEIGRAHV